MKYYGIVGFVETSDEERPGVFEDIIKEFPYRGDVLQKMVKRDDNEWRNDNINISNRISILADPYAREHFHCIKFVEWHGVCWEVNSVNVAYPRLELSIGGVYNGERAKKEEG